MRIVKWNFPHAWLVVVLNDFREQKLLIKNGRTLPSRGNPKCTNGKSDRKRNLPFLIAQYKAISGHRIGKASLDYCKYVTRNAILANQLQYPQKYHSEVFLSSFLPIGTIPFNVSCQTAWGVIMGNESATSHGFGVGNGQQPMELSGLTPSAAATPGKRGNVGKLVGSIAKAQIHTIRKV